MTIVESTRHDNSNVAQCAAHRARANSDDSLFACIWYLALGPQLRTEIDNSNL